MYRARSVALILFQFLRVRTAEHWLAQYDEVGLRDGAADGPVVGASVGLALRPCVCARAWARWDDGRVSPAEDVLRSRRGFFYHGPT